MLAPIITGVRRWMLASCSKRTRPAIGSGTAAAGGAQQRGRATISVRKGSCLAHGAFLQSQDAPHPARKLSSVSETAVNRRRERDAHEKARHPERMAGS
jgi:hypothetical protein